MKRILCLTAVTGCFFFQRVQAQESGNYIKLKADYNKALAKTTGTLNNLYNAENDLPDSVRSKIIFIQNYNEKKFQALSDIDSAESKSAIAEEAIDLKAFYKELGKPGNNVKSATFIISQKADELRWIADHRPMGLGLDECKECFFVRNIEVLVLKRNSATIDTVKCATVSYIKRIPFGNNDLAPVAFNSYPCKESYRKVSNGRFHNFKVKLGTRIYEFEREVSPASNMDDVKSIELIIEND